MKAVCAKPAAAAHRETCINVTVSAVAPILAGARLHQLELVTVNTLASAIQVPICMELKLSQAQHPLLLPDSAKYVPSQVGLHRDPGRGVCAVAGVNTHQRRPPR